MASRRFVFLIGAARSGTKFLRDTIAVSQDVAAVPYDINYVWRHGNEGCPHDEITPEDINEKTAQHIRRTVERLALKGRDDAPRIILEKTVSNTLRMETVRRIFPEAEFIVLERNGLDVVESSYRQWTAPPERGYLLEKLRYFPVREWRYGLWFARNLVRPSSGPPIWGPRYSGIEYDLDRLGTAQTCATQWAACVRSSRASIRSNDTHTVEYASLANSGSLTGLLSDLGISDIERVTQRLNKKFKLTTTWPGQIPDADRALCEEIVRSVGEV